MAKAEDKIRDFHREVSIMFLQSSSGFAVRTPKGQKDPGVIQWDPRTNSREKSNQTIENLRVTNDNLGIHLFGSVVDVDIDTDNAFMTAALDYFLPATNHVWGRPSRPRTHRIYELAANQLYDPAEFPFLEKIKNNKDIAVEVRGGEQKSGRYSLLPGSMHPTGEMYEWSDPKAARTSPAVVDLHRLIDGVRLSCVVALIAPYWTEGVRNDLCKALSGFMHRAASFTEDLNIDLTFDMEKARYLLEGLLEVADDDPSDRSMRMRTFEQTWEKADGGLPVVGATRLVEITGNPDMLPILYALLAHTPDLMQLEAIFEQYAVIKNTTSIIDLHLGARGNYVMNKDSFVFTLAGRFISTMKGRVPISSIYLNSLQRTIVDRVGVDPQHGKIFEDEEGLKNANIWSGWAIEPAKDGYTDEDIAPFKDYMYNILARGDKKLYDWMMMWVADIFQNPSSKPGTALILVGRQGAGKTFLADQLLRPIIGTAHSIKVSTSEKLTSKFNAHMSGKLLVLGEEVINSNRRIDNEMMKDMITSQMRAIEMKGRDAFEMKDYARYILTSNHIENAVNIGEGDRRHTIVHVSEEYAYYENRDQSKQNNYWGPLWAWATERDKQGRLVPNQANLAKLHAFLLDVTIDERVIRVAHETDVKRATRLTSTRGVDAWLLSMIEFTNPFENMREADRGDAHSFVYRDGKYELTDEWPEYVPYSLLEASLRMHSSREYGESRTAQQIAKLFKDNALIPHTEDKRTRVFGRKVRIRPFPSKPDLIEFLKLRGYPVLDVNDEDDEKLEEGVRY